MSHHLEPKRARRICSLFSLSKEDDVHQCAGRKPPNEGKKPRTKAPKLRRLIAPRVLRHTRIALKKQRIKKKKEEAVESAELLAKKLMEAKETGNRFPRDVDFSL